MAALGSHGGDLEGRKMKNKVRWEDWKVNKRRTADENKTLKVFFIGTWRPEDSSEIQVSRWELYEILMRMI